MPSSILMLVGPLVDPCVISVSLLCSSKSYSYQSKHFPIRAPFIIPFGLSKSVLLYQVLLCYPVAYLVSQLNISRAS